MVARSREAAGRQLEGHRADLFAVCLFVLGAIFALGLWTDLAGPVGSALADGTGAVLGRARVALPVACFAFGVVLLWPRRAAALGADDETISDADADESPTEAPTLRIAIGALLLFIADVGILHLAYGRPALSGDLDDLRNAGVRSAPWSPARSSPPSASSVRRSCSARWRWPGCSSSSVSRSA